MYIRMLLIAITFLIFPVGISNLYALPWCGCGNCMMMYANPPKCTCGYPFYWCLEDLRALQLQASLHNRSAENNSIPESLTPTITQSAFTDGNVYLMSGSKCLQKKVTLHLLASTRETLKLKPIHFDAGSMVF